MEDVLTEPGFNLSVTGNSALDTKGTRFATSIIHMASLKYMELHWFTSGGLAPFSGTYQCALVCKNTKYFHF